MPKDITALMTVLPATAYSVVMLAGVFGGKRASSQARAVLRALHREAGGGPGRAESSERTYPHSGGGRRLWR
jgi:hypothetical protein